VRGKVTLYAKRYPLYAIKVASNERRATSNESGVAAIALVIMVVIILLTLMGGLVLLTTTGYKSYQFSKDRAQALCLAEAGISQALREIRDNEDYDEDEGVGSISDDEDDENNPTLTYSKGSSAGSYWVKCVPSGDSTTYPLYSTGTVNEISRTINAIYLSGLESSAAVTHKTIPLNYDPDEVIIIGEVIQLDELPVPDMVFFHDNANHYEVGGEQILTGVYYVTGNVHLSQGVTLRGSIVVEGGKLTVNKECIIDPSQNPDEIKQDYPAVVVAGDNAKLTIVQNCTISGLVYCSDDVSVAKENTIEGALIGDDITIGKDVTITLEDSFSVPGFTGGNPAVILLSDTWQSS